VNLGQGLPVCPAGFFFFGPAGERFQDRAAPQSAGGNTIGQKFGAGVSNSKATASAPPGGLSTRTTRHFFSCPFFGLTRNIGCPGTTSIFNVRSPPWAFTTSVCASSCARFPSVVSVLTTTGTCSNTRSLRRLLMGWGAFTFFSASCDLRNSAG
jgi:hypothetical protein